MSGHRRRSSSSSKKRSSSKGKRPATSKIELTPYADDLKLPHLIEPLSSDGNEEKSKSCHVCCNVLDGNKVTCRSCGRNVCRTCTGKRLLSPQSSAVSVCHECLPVAVSCKSASTARVLREDSLLRCEVTEGGVLGQRGNEWMITTGVKAAEAAVRNPVALVFVIDRSYSMKAQDLGHKSRLDLAKDAAKAFLSVGRLTKEDSVGLVAFDHEAVVQYPLTPGDSASRELPTRIDALDYGGATDVSQALVTALTQFQDTPNGTTKLILLLTDGFANRGVWEPTMIIGLMTKLLPKVDNLFLDVFGCGIHDSLLLQALSLLGKGKYMTLLPGVTVSSSLNKRLAQRLHMPIRDVRVTYWPRGNCRLLDPVQFVQPDIAKTYPGSIVDETLSDIASGQDRHVSAGVRLSKLEEDGFVQVDIIGTIFEGRRALHFRRLVRIPGGRQPSLNPSLQIQLNRSALAASLTSSVDMLLTEKDRQGGSASEGPASAAAQSRASKLLETTQSYIKKAHESHGDVNPDPCKSYLSDLSDCLPPNGFITKAPVNPSAVGPMMSLSTAHDQEVSGTVGSTVEQYDTQVERTFLDRIKEEVEKYAIEKGMNPALVHVLPGLAKAAAKKSDAKRISGKYRPLDEKSGPDVPSPPSSSAKASSSMPPPSAGPSRPAAGSQSKSDSRSTSETKRQSKSFAQSALTVVLKPTGSRRRKATGDGDPVGGSKDSKGKGKKK